MNNQITFTAEELKQFSKTSPLTIHELSKFIESKTSQQYVIVQRAMVYDLNQQLLSNIFHITEINNFLYNNWAKLIKVNQDITNKWKEDLQLFKR
jgi:hypothetical protein